MYCAEVIKRNFPFRFEVRTSRGIIPQRVCYYVKIWSKVNPHNVGIGEVAPLYGLSVETEERVEAELKDIIELLKTSSAPLSADHCITEKNFNLSQYSSSVRFGLVTGLLDLYHGGKKIIFDSDFLAGHPLLINGLVWMADAQKMLDEAMEKIKSGFTCIKIKVGSLDFEQECKLLEKIRAAYGKEHISIRLDANGAFSPDHILEKLKRLSEFQIHSIEQPLKPADHLEFPELLFNSPIPVALDEQLIGIYSTQEKRSLLDKLKPAFIVIKPGIVGGFSESEDWINCANALKTGWWITSALESPIGLNALAQFTAKFKPGIPQGLGTGNILDDLYHHPLRVISGNLSLNPLQNWGF